MVCTVPVGEKIKEVLTWSGKTQKWLASQLDMPYSTFNGYICGRHRMSIDMVKRIADALDVSYYVLLNDESLPADSLELNEDERQMLARYRLLTHGQRTMIRNNMDFLIDQNPHQKGM